MPLFKDSLVEQSRPSGIILGMTLIQGKQENTCEGMQLNKKKWKILPISLGLWKAGVGHTVLKCFS